MSEYDRISHPRYLLRVRPEFREGYPCADLRPVLDTLEREHGIRLKEVFVEHPKSPHVTLAVSAPLPMPALRRVLDSSPGLVVADGAIACPVHFVAIAFEPEPWAPHLPSPSDRRSPLHANGLATFLGFASPLLAAGGLLWAAAAAPGVSHGLAVRTLVLLGLVAFLPILAWSFRRRPDDTAEGVTSPSVLATWLFWLGATLLLGLAVARLTGTR